MFITGYVKNETALIGDNLGMQKKLFLKPGRSFLEFKLDFLYGNAAN